MIRNWEYLHVPIISSVRFLFKCPAVQALAYNFQQLLHQQYWSGFFFGSKQLLSALAPMICLWTIYASSFQRGTYNASSETIRWGDLSYLVLGSACSLNYLSLKGVLLGHPEFLWHDYLWNDFQLCNGMTVMDDHFFKTSYWLFSTCCKLLKFQWNPNVLYNIINILKISSVSCSATKATKEGPLCRRNFSTL